MKTSFRLMRLALPGFALTVMLLGASSTAFGFQKMPGWLQQAASMSHVGYDKNVTAVVLHREKSVSLESSSKLVTVERTVVKILTREGRKEAVGIAFYLSKFSQVRDMEAWLIAPGGTVKAYGKKETIDQISDPDDIYDEGRVKVIDASNDSDVGYVFGFTATVEERPLFYQDKWSFQDDLPTAVSRYTLALPEGWKATSMTFNGAQVPARQNGNAYSWEVRDLPPIPREPMSPSFTNLAPRIAVNYYPESGGTKNFANWTDVSRWVTGLYDPQVIVNDEVAIKARDLTANAKTELDKIRAIAEFVQNLQYISIDIGVGYGNGMKPRASDVVLGRGYGDCKDKANLMRALLRVLKIDAYPIAIYSGDPTYVRPEWASPDQFNHCIIAVRVSSETTAPTILEHKTLGRLLIFDATDPFTPVGDLPDTLQGSYGMILAGEKGDLSLMPITSPEANRLDRTIEATLDPQGGIVGKVNEITIGQAAAYERARHRSLPAADYNRSIENWIGRGIPSARTAKVVAADNHAGGTFRLDAEFSANTYAQLMQNRLMVFKPAIVGRLERLYLAEGKRNHSVVIDSTKYTEKVTVKLPAGFAVDEMPTPAKLETSFGKYTADYQVTGDSLVFTRTLVLNRATIPADKYDTVKNFFGSVHAAEQSPVVLIRK